MRLAPYPGRIDLSMCPCARERNLRLNQGELLGGFALRSLYRRALVGECSPLAGDLVKLPPRLHRPEARDGNRGGDGGG